MNKCVALLLALAWVVTANAAMPAPTAWYDATDASTLWKDDGAGGLEPAIDGQRVDLWQDKSGNGIDLYSRNQGLDNMWIGYSTTGRAVNGQPAVAFSIAGTASPSAGGAQNNTYLTSWDTVGNPGGNGATNFLASNELTIYAIGRWNTLTSAAVVSVYDTTHGAPEWGQNDPDSSMEDGAMIGYGNQSAWHSNYMSNYAGTAGSGGAISIIEGVFGAAPADTATFVDGVMGSYPPSTSSNDAWGTQHVLGDLDDAPFSPRGVKLGHGDFWHPGFNYADFDVCEVLIYTSKLTDADRWEVGAYLSQKYTVDYTNNVNTAIPEPATMMLIGLGSLALLRRRRR